MPDAYARLKLPRKPRSHGFRIVEFENRSGSKSWRVQGWVDGQRIRENFESNAKATERRRDLEADHLTAKPDAEALRATTLSPEELHEAESCWVRLRAEAAKPGSLLAAVEHWIRNGREVLPAVVYFGDALDQFQAWLKATPSLRHITKENLRLRLDRFRLRVGTRALHTISAHDVQRWLDSRKQSLRSRDNDRLALSRLFSWAMELGREWIKVNPVRIVKTAAKMNGAPAILSVDQSAALLKAAKEYRGGQTLAHFAVGLFGCVRTAELNRLTWAAVNLADGELRIEADDAKTGRARVIEMPPNLVAWLKYCEAIGQTDFKMPQKPLEAVRILAGLRQGWAVNVVRHTAISHTVRKLGSYALAADQAGNSEKIIVAHYKARVTSVDTERYFSMLP